RQMKQRKEKHGRAILLLYLLYFLYLLYLYSFACLNFRNRFAAALANRGIPRVLSYVRGKVPAPFALLPVRALHGYFEARHGFRTVLSGSGVDEIHLGNNEERGQNRQIVFELGLKFEVG